MKTLGVIPARGDSKGLPRKNVLPILGKPVIAYTIEASLASRGIDRTVVSTDNDEIASVSREYGAEIVRRPDEMATDTAPIEWSLRHAVTEMQAGGFSPDVVVWMQANVPCREGTAIDRVLERMEETGAGCAATAYEVIPDFYALKTMKQDGRLVPRSESQPQIFRRQDAECHYLLDGAVVAVRTDILMESEGRTGLHVYLGDDIRAVVQDKRYALEIEDEQDLRLCEFYLRSLQEEQSTHSQPEKDRNP